LVGDVTLGEALDLEAEVIRQLSLQTAGLRSGALDAHIAA
jgi:hypothetical protein